MEQQPDVAGPARDGDPVDGVGPRTATSLFDLRQLIGGVFTLYGVVLVVAGFFVGTAKSDGININLWLGIAMLLLGLFFLGWARWRPLRLGPTSASARAATPTDRGGGSR